MNIIDANPGSPSGGRLPVDQAADGCSPHVEPVASIIIPARNCADHLRECLAPLAHTDLALYEVIVVNDASSDGTRAAAQEFGARVIDMPARQGPAAARNAGAAVARGTYLVFLDADVRAHPETVGRLVAVLEAHPEVAAVFGSYDSQPAAGNIVSQYRNLLHHHVHQTGSARASTFWAGCGAVRSALFRQLGGFDENYIRPAIEDIELGIRIRKAGHEILLDKQIQATHLKRWRFCEMVRTDIVSRGIPWTRLILREQALPDDLNIKSGQRACVLLAWLLLGILVAGMIREPVTALMPIVIIAAVVAADHSTGRRAAQVLIAGTAVIALCGFFAFMLFRLPMVTLSAGALLSVLMLLNVRFYQFLAKARGYWFALAAIPLHVLYFLYSGLALMLGVGAWVIEAVRRKVGGLRTTGDGLPV